MNNWKTFFLFCWLTALFMILVLFWDHYALKVDVTTPGYILVKGTTIVGLLLMGAYCYKVRKVGWQQEAYALLFYMYSFYGMAYIDMTYSFSFIEAFVILSLGMRTTVGRFLFVSTVGLIGLIGGHYYATEPLFVAAGQSYKPHSFTVTFILFSLSTVIHFIITRKQAQINELNEKFALVGRQSSFLMHEIKNPLNRVMANSEGNMSDEIMQGIRRDSQKISAIVSSVEMLIHNPESLGRTFETFNWEEVSDHLYQDFNLYLNSLNIKFDFSELKGEFFGNKALMYQLLKNNIINAVEAIGFRKDVMSEISIKLNSMPTLSILTISNTNSTILPKDIKKIFEPHFTTKKSMTNRGLGLTLCKNIVEAHQGKITVTSGNDLTSFEICLPQQS